MRIAALFAIAAGCVFGSVVAPRLHWEDGLAPCLWWRAERGQPLAAYVSTSPGGPPVAGFWLNHFFEPEDGTPVRIMHIDRPPGSVDPQFGREWEYSGIFATRDGARWWLYTSGEHPLTDDERRLVGRWMQRDGASSRVIEFLDGHKGRGSDGSRWTWIAAEDGLELGEIESDNVTMMHDCVLDADRRSFHDRGGRGFVGVRLDEPRGR